MYRLYYGACTILFLNSTGPAPYQTGHVQTILWGLYYTVPKQYWTLTGPVHPILWGLNYTRPKQYWTLTGPVHPILWGLYYTGLKQYRTLAGPVHPILWGLYYTRPKQYRTRLDPNTPKQWIYIAIPSTTIITFLPNLGGGQIDSVARNCHLRQLQIRRKCSLWMASLYPST